MKLELIMIPDFDAALVFVSDFSFFLYLPWPCCGTPGMEYGSTLESYFLSQLQIGLLQLKLQFFTVKNIRFLKLVERVSWSKKTQCGQQESPPDLQLSAQVLS